VMVWAKQLVWALVTCATVVAQVTPQGVCRACDRPCCDDDSSARCPLCVAEIAPRSLESPEQPCDCQLTARNEQPLAVSSGSVPMVPAGEAAVAPGVIPPLPPQVLGVSREYLAASLSVPIRPPRILFGVWRN
jgi:hypothetical protein